MTPRTIREFLDAQTAATDLSVPNIGAGANAWDGDFRATQVATGGDDPPPENCDGCVDDDDAAVDVARWKDELLEAELSANGQGDIGHRGEPDPDIRELLDAPEPEYDYVVPDLLEYRDRVIVTGGEGHGKTTHSRQFAIKSASGIHPYTDDDIEPVRSLFVDLENSVAQTRREFRPLLISAGDRYVRGMLVPIIEPAGIDLTRRADIDWLRERVERNMPVGLLFMGPLYKMAHGDFEEVGDAITQTIDRIRDDYGCAVLLEAHSPYASSGGRRPIRPFGPSVFSRWPEFGFHLAERGQLTSWRGPRDAARPWPTLLKRGGHWPWTVETNERQVTFARMIETVQDAGQKLSVRQLAKDLDADRNVIQRAIDANRATWNAVLEGLDE